MAAALRTLRIAMVGASPCEACTAACCKQNGHAYAARLTGDEVRRFAPFAMDVPIDDGAGLSFERVLPYVGGRCQFLGEDDLCAIYEDRPHACRRFQCVDAFNSHGLGLHGVFLERNPRVLTLLENV